MMFATIIREAGGSSKNFPIASNIPVTLYDGKDRVIADPNVHYVEPLFAKNRRGQANFFKEVEKLENEPVASINVRIDANSVILHYRSVRPKIFSRLRPLEPLDYMD